MAAHNSYCDPYFRGIQFEDGCPLGEDNLYPSIWVCTEHVYTIHGMAHVASSAEGILVIRIERMQTEFSRRSAAQCFRDAILEWRVEHKPLTANEKDICVRTST